MKRFHFNPGNDGHTNRTNGTEQKSYQIIFDGSKWTDVADGLGYIRDRQESTVSRVPA